MEKQLSLKNRAEGYKNDNKDVGKYFLSSEKDGGLIPKGNKLYLYEWQEYMIVGERPFTVKIGSEVLEANEKGENVYIVTFQFRNYIGKTYFEILENGKRIPLQFKDFEVLSEKVWKIYEGNKEIKDVEKLIKRHDEFYETLLNYIVEKSPSLPFSVVSPTGFVVEEGAEPINELFAYHYLRHNKERIIEAFETLLKKIKRKLTVEEEWLELHEVDEPSSDTLISITQHPEYLAPAKKDLPITRQLNGYIPTKVLSFKKYEDLDTPENRFAKYFLEMLIRWADRVLGVMNFKDEVVAEIRRVVEELEFIRTDEIWQDIGDMMLFPYTSQTLLKGDGYRDLLELYRGFIAYVPFFGELHRAIDNKNISKLYEYWCFFRLLDDLEKILGKCEVKLEITLAGELSESGDVYAQFDSGWRLHYNKRMSPQKESYSVSLRPDFSLFKEDELVGVFDAKFKFDIVDEKKEIEEFDKTEEEIEKRRYHETWAKLEDVYKMHTYRDALKPKFALVLYPGKRNLFFDARGVKVEEFRLEDVLNGDFSGVGYLSFVPEVRIDG